MTLSDLEHFRNLLLERQDNIQQWIEAGAGGTTESKEKAQALLVEIKTALGRVEHQTYGECKVCHGEVERHRLEVQPTSQVCLECISKEEKAQLEEELFLASKIHRALLPHDIARIDGFEVAVKSLAARTVGGDYFDFFPSETDGPTRVVIADAMGKGLPAGLLMSNIQGALKILSEEIESPSQLITRLNRWLCHNVPVTKFVSLACVAIESEADDRSRIIQANAGHCPPVLVRHSGAIERLNPTGGVLGVHDAFDYCEETLYLDRGDLLLLYTDGVTETENESGEMFDESRMIEFLKANHSMLSLEALLAGLYDEVMKFSGHKDLQDDFTIIAVRKQ
ncbi:putative Serine phosphatase [Candidatus Zixiibacteriota bacterium]|nr:putative Serine phosphatase [candidate division Zixibacteria bacterium]